MQKLLDGIRDFHTRVRPGYRETFASLALGQSPDCLMVACSDSRVVPNLFASTDPGDLFVVRNVGNLVPPCDDGGRSVGDRSEAAAVEFAVGVLGVRDIVVCGHSECGAMRATLEGTPGGAPHLDEWLDAARPALTRLGAPHKLDPRLAPHNRLSQLNVLQQLEHLRSYPLVRRREAEGALRLNAWWFDIAEAEVLAWEEAEGRFVPIA